MRYIDENEEVEFGTRYFPRDFWQLSPSEVIQKTSFFATFYRPPHHHHHHSSPLSSLEALQWCLKCNVWEFRIKWVLGELKFFVSLCLSLESG